MPIEPCGCIVCEGTRSARLNDEVGNPNSEGVSMPEAAVQIEEIHIPVPPTSAGDIFQALSLTQGLAADRSPEAWEAGRQALEAALQPIVQPIQVGGYGRDVREVRLPSGALISTFDVDTARDFVRIASDSQMIFEQQESGVLNMRPITNLENAGWELYVGEAYKIRNYPEGGLDSEVPYVSIYDLKDRLIVYRDFRRTERRAYIKQALKKARQQVKKEPAAWTPERAVDFEAFLRKVKARLRPESDPFLKLPILPHKTLSSRNWGIEIEAVDIAGVKTPKEWSLKGDGSLRGLSHASYPSRSLAHSTACKSLAGGGTCNCAHEKSVSSDYTETGEWVSPVLRSYHSRGLEYMGEQIEFRNTNHTAGVHVHVEASDLTPTQATMLSVIYSTLEPLFESEYQRQERKYCKGVDTAELINRFNALRDAKKHGKAVRDMQFSSRYWTVNAAALSQHGTIEFRAMGPRYNYEHLIRWAYLCRELVNIAKANVPQKAWTQVQTIEDLVVLFSKYGKETPTPEWAGTVASSSVLEALGSENRRLQHVSPLRAGDTRPPHLVFDDYTSRVPLLEDAYA